MTSSAAPLLELEDVRVATKGGRGKDIRSILTGVDLQLMPGETIGIVGESGSGKSMLAKSVARLLPQNLAATGRIVYRGTDLLGLSDRSMEPIRGSGVSLLYQDPFTMLNPLLRCGDHITEGLTIGRGRKARQGLRDEAVRRLAEVGIEDPDVARKYPFQLSGGMRQRVALAAALARDPDLLIADEPSTALDVTTQAQILKLLRSIQEARGMGLIMITHDLRVAFSVCSRVYVLYAGRVLESAPASALGQEPLHPYSLALLISDPPVDRTLASLPVTEGNVPTPDSVAGICGFAPRCTWANDACRVGPPPLVEVEPGRSSACIRLDDIRSELKASITTLLVESEAPARRPSQVADPVLRIDNLCKSFAGRHGRDVHALRGVSLEVGRNESVGLVGESGSGKSTLARCLVGLETSTSGSIEVGDLTERSGGRDQPRHKTVQLVFQDPYSSLDPKQTVGDAIKETLRANGYPRNRSETRAGELFAQVGLPASYLRRLPTTLSGGERQRVAIARALAVEPELIVFDEPVSALDVSVQAQVLNLLKDLRKEFGISYLFISHDLAVVRQVVERVYVCYRGSIVEQGPVDQVLERPSHEYTRRLIASIPRATDEQTQVS
jgi:peptide/nickel transport system ATP-binding protein